MSLRNWIRRQWWYFRLGVVTMFDDDAGTRYWYAHRPDDAFVAESQRNGEET